ncbi:ABC transporter permease [Natronosalvus vescus]|uniref:ABC transporter permease n=1 Tax=Natronosalvus vescus TaxID=2953881 RepID=UPI0020917774|nr:ABC transporter permease [Natronosalvus vescus]
MELGVVAGVIAIGFIHGVLPDHGWPIAATYALERPRRWLHGFVAALILGVGHLVSSVVLVLAYFWVSGFAAFAEGPMMKYIAGTLLILLGLYEYRYGGHGHLGDGHDHGEHDGHDGHDNHHEDSDHAHRHDHEHEHGNNHDHGGHHEHEHGDHHEHDSSRLAQLRSLLPGNGHQHLDESHAERGLFTLGTTALVLGFAHEEPIQILAICIGTERCLELMLVYSLAVIVAIIVPTLLLIAGYERHRETVERYTRHFPTLTAAVLIVMGLAFISGLI